MKKFIASSNNNISYIQVHHFTQKTLLNQWLYHTIQYFEPNTKSKGGGNHPPSVADVTIKSLVACRLTFCSDARRPIQQIVKIVPLLTLVHVSGLICCTCFQKEIPNYCNVKKSKIQW